MRGDTVILEILLAKDVHEDELLRINTKKIYVARYFE